MFWVQYALTICSAVCEIIKHAFFTCFQISRMLAAKAALATRVDALGEDCSLDLGAEHKVKVEARIRLLEEGNMRRISGTGKAKAKFEKYHSKR
jgi:nucleolar protein 58